MEINKVYNDPVDTHDVVNKNYVDEGNKKNIKYTDDSIKKNMKYTDESIKTTINNINDGKLIFDNIYTNNIKTSNILDLDKAFVRGTEGVNISINSLDIVLSATASAETLFGTVELIDLRGLEGKSITIAWDFDTNRDDLKKYFNYLRPEIWYYNPKTGERENLTWGFLNGNSITIRENLNDYYLLEVVFFLTNTYTTAHVDADFKIGDWVAYKNLQINIGTKKLPYIPYKKYGYNSQESMGKIVVDDISCKNKFNKYGSLSDYRQYSSGTTTLESNGKIKATANITNGNGKGQIIQLKPNTTYTFSAKIDSVEVAGSTTFRILKVLSDDTAPNDGKVLEEATEAIAGKTYTYQFTTGETGKIWLTLNGINNNDYNIFKYVIYDNIQIEEGTDTTNYSEYKGFGYTSGRNANGSWVKYDDGRMECWGVKSYSNVDVKVLDITEYYGLLLEQPFPQTFKNKPVCIMSIDNVQPGYAINLRSTGNGATETHTPRMLAFCAASVATTRIDVHYHAYGYWK